MKKICIHGEIVRGLRGASGLAYKSSLSNVGTIAKQKPYFKSARVERVDSWYEGTINLSIEPKKLKILKPDYVVTAKWMPNTVETFWLVDVVLEYKGKRYPAYIYYPCPSPVKAHADNIIELLTEKVESLSCGDTATIEVLGDKITLLD